MADLPQINDIAPADRTAWYRAYWLRVGVGLGLGFLLALAGVLYWVVTRPLLAALAK